MMHYWRVLAILLSILSVSCRAPEEVPAAPAPLSPPKAPAVVDEPSPPLEGPPIEKVNAHESVYSAVQLDMYRRACKRLNITHTILVGHFEQTFLEGTKWDTKNYDVPNNEFVLTLAAESPGEFSAIVMVNPADPDVLAKIRGYVDRGAVGVQTYDFLFAGGLANPRHDAFFQFLESNRIPLSLRTGVRKSKGLRPVDTVLNKYPFLKVLIPHYMVAEDVPEHVDYLMRKHDNLYTDLSYGFKKWRTTHFKRISEHIDAVRDLVERYQDRVLWGTDIVVGRDGWKTEDYIDASYEDYAGIMERKRFRFSLTGEVLNGFGFDRAILKKLYRDNAMAFLGQRPEIASKEIAYLERLSDEPDAPAVDNGVALLVLVSNVFSPTEDVAWRDGQFAFPGGVGAIYVDERLKALNPVKSPKVAYAPKDDVLARVAEDKAALGVLSLGDLTPRLKLVTVNGISPLDRGLRMDKEPLARYPLAVPAGQCRAAPEDVFNPYNYYSILITGRSLIGQGLKTRNEFIPAERLVGKISGVTRDSDLTHLSLETSFVPDGTRPPKRFAFCTEMRNFNVLPYLGVDIVSLTGNHLTDLGREHFAHTLDLYDRYNIRYYGGGRRDAAAEYVHTMNLYGTRMAFIGFNNVSGAKGIATPELAGSHDLQFDRFESEVRLLAQRNDVVVVDFQAGFEFPKQPTYFQRRLAAMATRAGASVVTFLHAHTMRGFEFFGDTACFYGPGNFVFFHPSEKNDTANGFIVKYRFHKARLIQCEMIPIAISSQDLALGDKAAFLARQERLHAWRNTKSPTHQVYTPLHPPKYPQPNLTRTRRFAFIAADLSGFETVAPGDVAGIDTARERPVFIDGASFLLEGDLSLLNKGPVYVLFSFDGTESLDAFRDAVQNDRERIAEVFRAHADRIVFGGNPLVKPNCDSRRGQYFFSHQLMTTCRNLLEREDFYWPNWRGCDREWSYDYREETPVKGLNLPDDVLRTIYYDNFDGLLDSLTK